MVFDWYDRISILLQDNYAMIYKQTDIIFIRNDVCSILPKA